MNHRSDIDRVMQVWMEDGPTAIPDRVVDVVAARIGAQRQRRGWPFVRRLPMNPLFKLGAAAAAVLAIAIVGWNLLPGGSGPGGRTPSPSPTASPPPSDSPAASIACEDDLPGCAGSLTAGDHQSNQFEPGLTFTTPDGWRNVIDLATIYKLDPTSGYPYVLVWGDASIAIQDASCSATPDPTKGRKAADWIAMLTTHPGLVASAPISVDVGGREMAQQVELALDPGWTATCPQHDGPHVSFLTQQIAGRASEYGLGGNERVLVTAVDIGRRTVVIESYGPADPESFATSTQSVRALIASFRFRCTLNDGPCGA